MALPCVPQGLLDVKQPISLTYCPANDRIFVGDKKTDSIMMFDGDSLEHLRSYRDDDLNHPTGLACFDSDKLYALSQDDRALLEFDLTNGRAVVIVDDLPDAPEALIVSSSC
jgi:hypothetical protein